nr:pre-rrna-processing protein ipi1 [Quercus suber]
MGSSAKKKREKQKDFQKTKLKVGKARPKNTNATDTSFAAKSIVLKQQTLTESGQDAATLFNHNLSLLSTKNETQRKDALAFLTASVAAATEKKAALPQPVPTIVAKAQSLILDGSKGVREQLLKFFHALPAQEIGGLDQLLLYTRAGMAHMSTDIKLSSLDVLDWLLETSGEAVMGCPGGWIKTLQTFQNLLTWQDGPTNGATSAGVTTNGKWSNTKPTTNLGNNKLLVHQLTTLARFLATGLRKPPTDSNVASQRAASLFPLWHTDAHCLPQRSNSFGYLNLFGAARNVESEVYEDADERADVFTEMGLHHVFAMGAQEVKKEGGEVGRAASGIEKALRLVPEVG